MDICIRHMGAADTAMRKQGVATLLFLFSLLATPAILAAPVASYHVSKQFLADFTYKTDDVILGPASYRYLTHALGSDKHNTLHKDQKDTSGALFDTTLINGIVQGNPVTAHYSQHHWTSPISFDQGSDTFLQFETIPSTTQTTHTFSKASAALYYQGLPEIVAGLGAIVLDGKAEITNLPLHPPEGAYANAQSAGEMSISGKLLYAGFNTGEKSGRVVLKVGQTSLRATGFASHLVPAKGPPTDSDFKDPIALNFFDAVTGELIAGQDLFLDHWRAEGNASVSYDPLVGLSFIADADSQAFVTMNTLSAWVLNPFNGVAGIVDGIFSATGDFAALPWLVSSVDGQTTATLAASDLALDFEFLVLATGLGTPANDVLVEISGDAQGSAEAFLYVPEPSSGLLLLIGGLVLWGAGWQRNTRRGRVSN